MLALAAAAVIAGILVLVLSGGGGGSHHKTSGATLVQAAAGYLGVPSSEVRQKVRSGESIGQIAASTHGSSRSGLIEAIYQERAAAIKRQGLTPAAEHAALASAHHEIVQTVDHKRTHRGLLVTVASYLGISEAQLRSRLATHHTLAAVANATPGRSRAGLVDALVADRRQKLETALREKAITRTELERAVKQLHRRFERSVARPLG